MSTWQITLLCVTAGCAIGCLLSICIVINKLGKSILSIGSELTKMNAKLEAIEAVNKDDVQKSGDQYEPDFAGLEAAISNFEKLKRIDVTKAQEDKG